MIGQHLPGFSLENQYGETVTSRALSAGQVLLVFYPWAFSRVCGAELAQLQAQRKYFQEHAARLVAISVDHKFALRSYAEQSGIEFDLLADFWPHGEVASMFNAFDRERGVAKRVTLLVREGVVIDRFEAPLSQGRDLSSYRRVIES